MVAEHITDQDLARFACLLQVPQIPASDVARLRRAAAEKTLSPVCAAAA
jgi:hypothetical protein